MKNIKEILQGKNKLDADPEVGLLRSSGLFDQEWYLAHNPDVANAKVDPTEHYLHYGGFEGRDPGPGFSSALYLDAYKDVKEGGINPLVHYVTRGRQAGYVIQNEDMVLIRSSGLFDQTWYLDNNPEVANAKVDPVFHYLYHGGFEGCDPGTNFSSKWYLDTYVDVKKAGINPLVHYVRYGKQEGRLAQPKQNEFANTLYSALLCEILEDAPNFFGSENWDEMRFGEHKQSFASKILIGINRLLKTNFVILPGKTVLPMEFGDIMNHLEGFAALYNLLADQDSKNVVVKLIAYRILGYQKVKLPFAYTWDRAEDKKLTRLLMKTDETIKIKFNDWDLHRYDFHSIGYPIEGFFYGPSDFMIKQYQYTKSSPSVLAQSGDVVIDGGACWGDTALYFANLIGENGKVYSFEFVPDNIDIMHRNLALNPLLASRVEIVPMALSDTSGEKLSYSANGPGTRITNGPQDMSFAETVTIDDFVERQSIDRVNFIKMDIEGAELSALRGAEKTLRKFRPKLAICLYHSLDDFTLIPEFLNKLDLSYIFYVDHFTIHQEETILFAYPVAK